MKWMSFEDGKKILSTDLKHCPFPRKKKEGTQDFSIKYLKPSDKWKAKGLRHSFNLMFFRLNRLFNHKIICAF